MTVYYRWFHEKEANEITVDKNNTVEQLWEWMDPSTLSAGIYPYFTQKYFLPAGLEDDSPVSEVAPASSKEEPWILVDSKKKAMKREKKTFG